jgi:hypothetical protein
VLSKGAKFIGTGVAGAEITIRDAETNELLARGKTAGDSGNDRTGFGWCVGCYGRSIVTASTP